MNIDQTRKHIHDLANNFSIIDAQISKTLTLLARDNPQLKDEIERLTKAGLYMKKSIDILREMQENARSAGET